MAIRGSDGSIILTTQVDESGLKKGLGSMKKLGATAGKAFLAIGAAAATATVAITKMAVSAYADYEQLVGGVETLFKGSAQKVIDYANDAFYTAGVSANEYMKQVTSFSASLIRSTAGDTEKAADIANMALIDISDNVNKMGSSMESVTLAYQGFAKQQYMLLDNLKLGYGGTKTEMERLLKDAQALTGVKYDINNLADVYSAIHAIQEELGIAGTTAKEAEQTITGSANMMKAAWQNVLSAVAGGGDLDRAINNLVYSISVYFANIVPVVERSLVGIGKLIEQVGPMLVQNVASALIQAIPSLINAVYQMIIGLAKGIWAGIKALFTGGTAQIKKQVSSVGSGGGISGGGISSGSGSGGTDGSSGGSGAKGKSAEETAIDNETKAIQDKIKALQKENKQISKNDKANQKANQKQLASFDDLTTLGSNQISEADAMIDKNNEEIDQLQEQLDLLREKKQAIQDAASAGGSGAATPEIGGISGGGGAIADLTMDVESEETGEQATWLSQRLGELTEAFSGLQDIDLTNLSNSLGLLKKPLEGLAVISWDIILWGIENVIVPLTSFTVEEILPRYFESLSYELRIFKVILDEGFTIFQQFYDNFLQPIASYAAEGFLQLWDTLNENLAEFVTILEGSTAWQDLQTILGSIYTVLEPVVKLLIDFVVWVGKLVINQSFTELEFTFLNIEDALGLIASLINGDFGSAWEHLQDLMWDNHIDKAKESLENLKKAFEPTITKVDEFVKEWKTKIENWWKDDVKPYFTLKKWEEIFKNISKALSDFFTSEDGFVQTWLKKIETWWNDNVAPWFTIDKWKTLMFNIGEGLAKAITEYGGLVTKWETEIKNWWDNNVTPWFTADKWKTLFLNICTGVGNFFTDEDGFVQTWFKKIEAWWTDDLSPWFTADKWKTLFLNICTGIGNFFNDEEDGFITTWETNIETWWNNNVAPWFTVDKWKELGKNIKDGIVEGLKGAIGAVATTVNNMIDGFQSAINGAIGLINSFADGWNSVADVTPLLPSISKIKEIDLSKYKIPGYARGTVVPPNKPFLGILGDNKNETEVVSPISTLKTAFMEAMLEMGGNFGGGNTEVVLEIDGREFGRAVVEQGNRENRRIGTRLVIA